MIDHAYAHRSTQTRRAAFVHENSANLVAASRDERPWRAPGLNSPVRAPGSIQHCPREGTFERFSGNAQLHVLPYVLQLAYALVCSNVSTTGVVAAALLL